MTTDNDSMEDFNRTGWVISQEEHDELLEEGITRYRELWELLSSI